MLIYNFENGYTVTIHPYAKGFVLTLFDDNVCVAQGTTDNMQAVMFALSTIKSFS